MLQNRCPQLAILRPGKDFFQRKLLQIIGLEKKLAAYFDATASKQPIDVLFSPFSVHATFCNNFVHISLNRVKSNHETNSFPVNIKIYQRNQLIKKKSSR